jgi:hypothetical protein
MQVHGEIEVETKLPTNNIPRVSMRLKVGGNHTLQDIVVDHRAANQEKGHLTYLIANQEYCPLHFTPQ